MTRGMNYEELIGARSALMKGLADHTDRTDHSTQQSQAERVGVGLSGSTAIPERVSVHRELVVTEGRKAVIVPPLQGQDHLDRLIIRLRLNVWVFFIVFRHK